MAGGITRRVVTVATGRAANVISLIFINAFLARGWSPHEVGVVLTLLVVVNSLLPLFQLGLPTGLLFFFPRKSGQEQRELIVQTLLLLALSGVMLCLVLFLVGGLIAELLGIDQTREGFRRHLLPFLPFVFAVVLGGIADSVLVATDRAHWLAGLAVAHAVVWVLTVVAAMLYTRSLEDLLLFFSLVALARLGAAVVLVKCSAKGLDGSWRLTAAGLSAYLKYAITVGLTEAIGGLSRFVDRYVVLFFFAGTTFSLYQFGALEVPVGILVTAVATVIVPEVSRLYADGNRSEIMELWRGSVARLSMGVLPLFCFLFAFSGPLFALYLPPEYAKSEWVFRIFLLVLPLRCATYNALLVGMGKARWALWASLADLFLNLVLSGLIAFWLIDFAPDYAFLGPAAATVIATTVQVGVLVMAIGWHLKWPFDSLLPWSHLGRVFATSCVASIISWFAVTAIGMVVGKSLIGGVVFVLVLAVSYWIIPSTRAVLRAVWVGIRDR